MIATLRCDLHNVKRILGFGAHQRLDPGFGGYPLDLFGGYNVGEFGFLGALENFAHEDFAAITRRIGLPRRLDAVFKFIVNVWWNQAHFAQSYSICEAQKSMANVLLTNCTA